MTRNVCIAFGVLACSLPAQNIAPITGQWTIAGPVILQRVPVKFFTSPNNSGESAIPLSEIRGLTASQLEIGMLSGLYAPVQFDVVREAGDLYLEGHLQNGGGGGGFTFVPNPKFAAEMLSLGIVDLSDRNAYVMAVHDVGTTYVRELSGLGVRPRSSNQLIGLGVQHVTLEHVREFYDLGYSSLTPEMLISMRVQGVSPAFGRIERPGL